MIFFFVRASSSSLLCMQALILQCLFTPPQWMFQHTAITFFCWRVYLPDFLIKQKLMQTKDIDNTTEDPSYLTWLTILPHSCDVAQMNLPRQNGHKEYNLFATLLSSSTSLTASCGLCSLKPNEKLSHWYGITHRNSKLDASISKLLNVYFLK